ncbi:hypothetical protein AMK59_6461, partial [Oryctes borbonicus]
MPSYQIEAVKGLTAKDMKSISSYVSSIRYMRKMVPLVIYNIVYNRVDFDKELFADNVVCNIPFKTFKSKIKNHILADIFFWCKGAADAIEKKCLSELYLIFKDKNNSENPVVENYKFTFSYESKPEPTWLPKQKDVVTITKQMFESIESLGKFSKMDKEIGIVMETAFFDDTPETYVPPYFKHAVDEPLIIQLSLKDDYNTVGYLRTGYHKMKCAVRGAKIFEESAVNVTIDDDDDDVEIIEDESPEKLNEIGTEIMDVITNDEEICNEEVISHNSKDDRVELSINEYKCPCDRNSRIEYTDYVKCSSCFKYQHLVCAGCMKASSVSTSYICCYCHTDDMVSFDKMLREYEPKNWKMVCFVRLFLYHCYTFKVWPLDLLQTLETRIRKAVVKWIKTKGLLNFDSKNLL